MNIEALRISPDYSSRDWIALKSDKAADWRTAAEIVRSRLEGRFLRFANAFLEDRFSGFVVLAIDSLLAEAVQQFRAGDTTGKLPNGRARSKAHIQDFLSGRRFQPDFGIDGKLRFYEDIRCGLLHQAEAKEMWLIRRGQEAMLQKVENGKGYILDVQRFHAAVQLSLEDYYGDIADPAQVELRKNLWTKMDHICRIRQARGLLYEA